jgi:hypothetical protein
METFVGKNHSKKAVDLIISKKALSPTDYELLLMNWNIEASMADRAGFQIATDQRGSEWLYMPIYKNMKEVHAQMRKWGLNASKQKYMTRCAPEPGLVWTSHVNLNPLKKWDYCVIVEGILDGVYVGEIAPTVAILGSALPPERVETIHSLAERYIIMLDADIPKQALTIATKLGILKSRVIQLPTGDPTDYSHKFLKELIDGVNN